MGCGEVKSHCQQCSPRLGPFDPCHCLPTPVPPCHSSTHPSSTLPQLYPPQFHPATVIPTPVPPVSYTHRSSTPSQLYPPQFHPDTVIPTPVPLCHSYTDPSSTRQLYPPQFHPVTVIPTSVPPRHSYTHPSVTVYPLQFHPVTVYPIFITPSPFKCNVDITVLSPSMSVNDATVSFSPSVPHLALIIDSTLSFGQHVSNICKVAYLINSAEYVQFVITRLLMRPKFSSVHQLFRISSFASGLPSRPTSKKSH